MGFFITSAVFGGIITISFGTRIVMTLLRILFRYSCGNVICKLELCVCRNDSYHTKIGLAAMILALGVIELGTGICVAICLCMMRPCCTGLEVLKFSLVKDSECKT